MVAAKNPMGQSEKTALRGCKPVLRGYFLVSRIFLKLGQAKRVRPKANAARVPCWQGGATALSLCRLVHRDAKETTGGCASGQWMPKATTCNHVQPKCSHLQHKCNYMQPICNHCVSSRPRKSKKTGTTDMYTKPEFLQYISVPKGNPFETQRPTDAEKLNFRSKFFQEKHRASMCCYTCISI
jgi:hypothetical protein